MPDTHGAGAFAPIRAAEITDEIWLEVARHHAGGAPARAPPDRARPSAAPDATPTPIPPRLTLPALLALDGAAFIEAAYATVLGRAPDAAGTGYFSAALAGGRDKMRLLGELQASEEGRRSGRTLPGLRRGYLARRLYRIPVLGRVARVGGRVMQRAAPLLALPTPRARIAAAEFEQRLATVEAGSDSVRRMLEDRVAELQGAVELSNRRLAAVQSANEELGRKTQAASVDQGRRLSLLTDRAAGFTRQLEATEDSVIDSLLALSDKVADQARRLRAIEGSVDHDTVTARIERAAGGLRAELDGRVIAAEAIAAQNRRDVVDQQRRIGLMLNALRENVPAADAQDDHALDALYLAFEDRFRGTREDVKQRQRAYLPRLREAGIGTAARPVLDIGAGRGEFLELMQSEHLAASGVDVNAAMVALCRDAGLDCTQGDALAYLAALPSASLGAVTGFHVVEHLPFKTVVRILDEALRALAPGGLIILETPNPANLLTASRYFYLDPTHRHPLPGEMMAMIAEARGFVDAEVVEMHPMTARFPGTDRQLASALDRIFHGPQDYALIARRPRRHAP